MPYSLAFLGLLAFVGFVLWLRDRRAETVAERLAQYEAQQRDTMVRLEAALAGANQNAESFAAAARDVKVVKDELSTVRMRLATLRRPVDPVIAMPDSKGS